MPVDVSGTLRQALAKLETEKARIDHQIAAIRQALKATGGAANTGASARAGTRTRGRKRMSPAERKAVSARMKSYWAKRKRASQKKVAAKAK